jgi:hypothetical protein
VKVYFLFAHNPEGIIKDSHKEKGGESIKPVKQGGLSQQGI